MIPRNSDLLFGRTYNQFIFVNTSFDLSARLTTGIEVSSWQTLYAETRTGQIPDDLLTPTEPGQGRHDRLDGEIRILAQPRAS